MPGKSSYFNFLPFHVNSCYRAHTEALAFGKKNSLGEIFHDKQTSNRPTAGKRGTIERASADNQFPRPDDRHRCHHYQRGALSNPAL